MKKQAKNPNIKTVWNMGLMYKNHKDPQIEKDMQEIEQACESFAKKWSKKKFSPSNKSELLKALQDNDKLNEIIKDCPPLEYFYLCKDLDTNNQELSAFSTQMLERFTKAGNKVLFFDLTLGALEKGFQKQLLQDKMFEKYHYFLEKIFIHSDHQLSESEEKILSLKLMPAYQMWVDANQKSIGKVVIKWKGKDLSIHKATGILTSLPRPERAKLSNLIAEQLKHISPIAEAELNAIVQDKKINDELRGYKYAYSATILDYQNTEREVMNLVKAVGDSYGIAHKLYNLKAKLMKLKRLESYDLGVDLKSTNKKFSFEEGVEIVRSAFLKVDPLYADILDRFVKNGQIDAYPRLGKRGGGYCWGANRRPTYILLNWSDDFESVMVLAHEMGHAVHSELGKKQPVIYAAHPTSTAETVSTLFENFVFEEAVSRLSEKERLYARYNRLQSAIMTVIWQIAWFQVEQQIHEKVRETGSITAEELTKLRFDRVKALTGKSVQLTNNYGWSWVTHVHIRYYFYVYSYAYGYLISTSLYQKYKKDASFISKINSFLSAGESESPYQIFKSLGIDTTKAEFWKDGVRAIEKQIIDLEKDCKKAKLIK